MKRASVVACLAACVAISFHASAQRLHDRTAELGLSIGNDAACWVDINNDGWTDLCAGGEVWRNDSGKRFTRIANVGSVIAADYDNDGLTDLFSWTRLKLYRNVGGTTFVEAGLPELPATSSRGACWADLDGDGWVDIYVGGFEDWDRQITFPSLILMNDRGKGFRLTWQDARYRARGVTACDFNRDGHMDVYVSNYRLQPNLLWLGKAGEALSGSAGASPSRKAGVAPIRTGAVERREAAAEYGVIATSPGFEGGHSIGACWGDFDNDGEMDLFAGNFAHVDSRGDQPKSRFLRNMGPRAGHRFEDKGPCGVFYQESYASPAAGDYDNDGRLDLYFTTVYPVASFGRPNHPALFRNEGGFRVTDATSAAGLPPLGATYQAAWADMNNDGRLDLVTDGKLFVNEGAESSWLAMRLWGDGKSVNRSAIGAQVRVRAGALTVTRQVEAGTGEGNQNDLTLHFGLGDHKGRVNVEVLWPNGKVQRLRSVATNRKVEIGRPVKPAPVTKSAR